MTASALLPSGATAQRVAGEISVSLTILPPSVLQSVALADVRIDRGKAPMRTSPTKRGAPIVISRLCRHRRGATATRRELVPSCVEARAGVATHEIERRADVGSSLPDDTVRVVRLRREFFVVPGT